MEEIEKTIKSHLKVINSLLSENVKTINVAINLIWETLIKGHTIFFCGNGGSAADAQHLAAEFTGRYKKERKGLSAIALTTDTSAITAIANDYGYEYVFSRQLSAVAREHDLLVVISTSGNSSNLLHAVKTAKKMNCKTIGLLGKGGGIIKDFCDEAIIINSSDTARIQESHIMIGHIFCENIDMKF